MEDNYKQDKIRKVLYFVELLILIFILGTLGYVIIEKYSLLDAVYMTAITISTVGFSEVAELSPYGKLFTVFLIFFGVTLVVYGLSSITAFFVEGEMKKYLRGIKMKKEIDKLEEHYIICGCGKTGHKIIEEIYNKKKKFLVIENNEETIEEAKREINPNIYFIKGDATKDEILLEAGIKKAKVLISVLPSDAENLFLTLTAKDLNKDIKIITKSIEGTSEKKLRKAGADFVISPLEIAAKRIVETATNPSILSFVEIVNQSGIEDLKFEFVEVKENSSINGLMLREAQIPQKTNLIVIATQENKKLNMNPMSSTLLNTGIKLLVLGNDEQIEKLKLLTN